MTEIAANDIVAVVTQNPSVALLQPERFEAFLLAVRSDINDLSDVDMSKAKDRDRVRSTAAGIVRHKEAIDKARLKLTEEWREKVNTVNGRGKDIKERLTSLAAKVREPLTAWEDAEKERVAMCRDVIEAMRSVGRDPYGSGGKSFAISGPDGFFAHLVKMRAHLEQHKLDEATFRDMLDEAVAVRDEALSNLDTAIARAEIAEAEAEELAALRAEKAKRETEDEARRQAEEAKAAAEAKAKRDAEEAERRKVEQAAREKRIAQEAAAKAVRDAEEKAAREKAEIERKHQQDLERERQIRINEERARAAEQAAAEKREANKRHRAKVMRGIAEKLKEFAIPEVQAVAIVKQMVDGEFPNVTVNF